MNTFLDTWLKPLTGIQKTNGTHVPQACNFDPTLHLDKYKFLREPKTTSTTDFITASRPESLNDFVGQHRAKRIFTRYIEVTKENGTILPHTLIHGNAGCGKTTLARILAKEIGVNFREITASTCKDITEITTLIDEVNGGILFIDEIHGLNRSKVEVLYSIMEDFKFNGKAIRPFTLIVATTEYGELLRNRKPFCDRFKIIVELDAYTPQDIEQLLRNYAKRKYPDTTISNVVFKTISWNSRNTPRLGIRLLDTATYFKGDVAVTLDNFNIVKDGYTMKDILILRYLQQNSLCGIESICSYANTPRHTYLLDIEPYLLQTGMIIRHSRGRKITTNGIRFLKSLSTP